MPRIILFWFSFINITFGQSTEFHIRTTRHNTILKIIKYNSLSFRSFEFPRSKVIQVLIISGYFYIRVSITYSDLQGKNILLYQKNLIIFITNYSLYIFILYQLKFFFKIFQYLRLKTAFFILLFCFNIFCYNTGKV